MRIGAAVLACLLLTGCAGAVEFRLEAPDAVRLGADGAAKFTVTGTLVNKSGETVRLQASTICLAEDWRILTDDGTVAAKPVEVVCIQALAARDLASGGALHLNHQVEIPPGRLAPDRAYRLWFSFWGYTETTEFETRGPAG